MDFAISEKMKTILELVNEFVDRELIPLEPEMASLSFKEMLPILKEKQKKVRQMELWAPNFPKDCGGLGLSLVEHGLLSEALGRTPLGHYVFWCQAPDAGNVEILHAHGTEEQKNTILPAICRGELSCCIGMSEPNAGSDLASLQAKAQRNDQGWQINGTKLWTSGAHEASYMVGLFRTSPQAENRHSGLTQFIIDMKNTDGVSVRPIHDLAGQRDREVGPRDIALRGQALEFDLPEPVDGDRPFVEGGARRGRRELEGVIVGEAALHEFHENAMFGMLCHG